MSYTGPDEYVRKFLPLLVSAAFMASLGAAEGVTVHSPIQETVETPFNFTLTYTGGSGDETTATCKILDEGGEVLKQGTATNDTRSNITALSLESRDYTYKAVCDDDGDSDFSTNVSSSSHSFSVEGSDSGSSGPGSEGGGGSGSATVPTVDDSLANLTQGSGREFLNTTVSKAIAASRNEYSIEAAFINHSVFIKAVGHPFNITNSSGGLVDDTSINERRMDTNNSNASEPGRYTVWNETSGKSYRIDLLSNVSDITGRINGGSLSPTNARVELRYWNNLSLIADNSNDESINAVNISQPTTKPWLGPNERLYSVNTTVSSFWIGVKTDNHSWKYHPSRGIQASGEGLNLPSVEKPRLHDFPSLSNTSTNITGRFQYQNGTAASGLEVRLTGRKEGGCPRCLNRSPRMKTPPVQTDITDSSGNFKFTGVTSVRGEYGLEITNSSHAGKTGSFFDQDVEIDDSSLEAYNAGNFTATADVGHINGTIEADSSKKYGLAAFSSGIENENAASYFRVQTDVDNLTMRSIPNGTYSLTLVQFTGQRPQTVSETVKVKEGQTTDVNFEFASKIPISGYVKKSNGNPVPGAEVTARNVSNFNFFETSTNQNGKFSFKVANDTGYVLSASPPENLDLSSNETTITINGSDGERTGNNLTLGTGATLRGKVESGGNPVSATVAVWREEGPGGFTYRSAETNSSGRYKIGGLTKDSDYKFDVYPHRPGVGENHSEFTLSADGQWRNVTLATSSSDVFGFIEGPEGSTEQATVELVNLENGTSFSRQTNSSGGYEFSDQPRGSFYRVKVKPENSSLSRDKQSFILSKDEKHNFTLEKASGIEGYVKNSSGTLNNAEVFAYNTTTQQYGWTTTESNGYYQIDVPPGSYNLQAQKRGYPLNTTSVSSTGGGTTTKNITLSSGETVSGYITKGGTTTSLNGSIGFWNSSRDAFAFSEIKNGKYSTDGMKNVSYNVWIGVESDKISSKTKSMGAPGLLNQKNWSVGANNGQKLNVSVTDTGGNSLANATVRTSRRENTTDSGGIAKLPKQPIETITLNVNKDGYKGVQRKISIGNPGAQGVSKTRQVSVQLQSINEIDVEVNLTKTGGSPVEGASVVFVSKESGVSMSSSAVTDGAGRATVKGLSEGDYLISAGIDEDTVRTNTTNLNVSNGWQEINPLTSKSEYSFWFNAKR